MINALFAFILEVTCVLHTSHATSKQEHKVDKQTNCKQVKKGKHASRQTNKKKACSQGTNVGLDLVSVDPLNWITDDTHSNKQSS